MSSDERTLHIRCAFNARTERNVDALTRITQAADIVGARTVLVHAINDQARKFYEHFDFEPSPVHELQPMLLMKDLRKALGE